MRPVFTVTTAVLAFLLLPLAAEPGSPPAPWISLFDGVSLTGWVDQAGQPITEGWEVVDGTIHRAAKGPHLFTTTDYLDFELEFEWKIAPGTNSGVKYRFHDGIGCEYQVIDDLTLNLKSGHGAGDLYDLIPGQDKPIRPAGEWNQSRILAQGDHLVHWLNLAVVMEVKIGDPTWEAAFQASKFKDKPAFATVAGPIMLQDHGGEVWFRALRIRTLPPVSE